MESLQENGSFFVCVKSLLVTSISMCLVLDQLMIPKFVFFVILITYLVDIVLIL